MLESLFLLSALSKPNLADINPFTVRQETEYIAQAVPVVREKGIDFELEGCGVTAGASAPLACDFIVVNTTNSEKILTLRASTGSVSHSRVIDGNGNEILSSLVTLGGTSSDYAVDKSLPPGIPIRARVSFEAVPENDLALVELSCWRSGTNGGSFNVSYNFFSR